VLPVAVEPNSLVWFGTVWLSSWIDLVWFVAKGLIYNGFRLIGFGVSLYFVGLLWFFCTVLLAVCMIWLVSN
jgi:hypothetical protein